MRKDHSKINSFNNNKRNTVKKKERATGQFAMVSITNTPDSPYAHTCLHLWVCILGMMTWAAV